MKLTITKKDYELINYSLDITFSDFDNDNFDGNYDELLLKICKLQEKIANQVNNQDKFKNNNKILRGIKWKEENQEKVKKLQSCPVSGLNHKQKKI